MRFDILTFLIVLLLMHVFRKPHTRKSKTSPCLRKPDSGVTNTNCG